MAVRMTLNVNDNSGTGQMSVSWWQVGVGNGGALNLLACTQAKVASCYSSAIVPGVVSAGSGAIAVTTAARIFYTTGGGNRIPVLLPSVDPTIFLADGETVDPTNASVLALSSVALASFTDAAGNLAVAYVSGNRVNLRLPGIQH